MVTSLFVACKGEVVSDGLLLSALALALPTAETIKAGGCSGNSSRSDDAFAE